MSRIVRYNMPILVSAMAMIVGCTESPGPNLANAINSTEPQQGESESARLTSKGTDVAGTKTESNSIGVGVSDGSRLRNSVDPIGAKSDSDLPGGNQPRKADQVAAPPHDHKHATDTTTQEDGKPKRNGRRPDGDDPDAPLIIPQVAEQQDDPPINNGREPSAKPIPEGERVAIEAKDVPAETLNAGRAQGAKPGAELATPSPSVETKPATPGPVSLADLSESVQALDKDGDGQLGLYEWPREKLAEFKTLDSNHDGFLTPAELVAGKKKASAKAPTTDDSETKVVNETPDAKSKLNTQPVKKEQPKAKEDPKNEKPPADAKQDENEASDKSDAAPEATKPEAAKPDTPKPDTPKPDTPKPDAPKPDAPKSSETKPDDTKPADTTVEDQPVQGS